MTVDRRKLKTVLYAIDYTLGGTKKTMNPDTAEELLYKAKTKLETMLDTPVKETK